MRIRRLVTTDATAYRGLMLDAYRLHVDAFTASVDERGALPLAWWESRIDHEFVAGAFDGGRLVGVAGLVDETRPKTRHKATLYGMYVDAAFTRRGVGERLVEAILDEAARRKPLRVVQLTVTEGNRAALGLYARCGFVPFGIEPFAISTGSGYVAKVHMWTDLVARARTRQKRDMAAVADDA
jgi:ribosomal protein S18 acetylase RimI-like enzyme